MSDPNALSCHDHGNCELCDALESENAQLKADCIRLYKINAVGEYQKNLDVIEALHKKIERLEKAGDTLKDQGLCECNFVTKKCPHDLAIEAWKAAKEVA